MPRPVLIFDFDGTVALGDGPVRAYARAVAAAAGRAESEIDPGTGMPEGAKDGYDAVRLRALAAGIGEEHLSAGYLASRALLATADAPVHAPEGLADFLREIDAERVLLTNAPRIRIEEALEVLGLAGLFDRILTDAAKPTGLETLLDSLDGRAVLSIGDVWGNDLAPAHARGHATALVGDSPAPDAAPDLRAARLSDLLDGLRAWTGAAARRTA